MKALVTGATGFLGRHLCRRLVQDGHAVVAFHRPTSDVAELADLGVGLAVGDVTDVAAVREALAGCDVAIHAAAERGSADQAPERLPWVNVEGTRVVARAAREARIDRLVHVSSVAAIGIPDVGAPPADESFRFNLEAVGLPYHRSKWLAEAALSEEVARGLNAVVVNPGTIFGPAPRSYRGGEMIEKVRRRLVMPYLLGGINVVHVEDVVDGIVRALRRGRTGDRYILGGENVSFRRIAEVSAAELSQRPLFVAIPPIATAIASAVSVSLSGLLVGRMPITHQFHYCTRRRQFYSSDKARRQLGYEAREFVDIARDYLAWLPIARARCRLEARLT